MKENQFGFEYSWKDLEPVRALSVVVAVAQFVGAVASLAIGHYSGWFENLWFGGAVASFPGFLIGLPIQHRLKPASLAENRVMVRRMGLISAVLSLAAFLVPLGALHAA